MTSPTLMFSPDGLANLVNLFRHAWADARSQRPRLLSNIATVGKFADTFLRNGQIYDRNYLVSPWLAS